jgi:hypothetical protein
MSASELHLPRSSFGPSGFGVGLIFSWDLSRSNEAPLWIPHRPLRKMFYQAIILHAAQFRFAPLPPYENRLAFIYLSRKIPACPSKAACQGRSEAGTM